MESAFEGSHGLAGFGRVASAAVFVFCALAVLATLRLAIAEPHLRRTGMLVGAEQTTESLRAAVASNPRDSSLWIALGLAAERAHEGTEAARYFAQAELVDRQYLPAWSSANFYFRQGHAARFWDAASRASALIYDDPRALIDLADRMESDPIVALSRLKATPTMERAYLDFLIGGGRWEGAQMVALRILARADPADSERLRDFTDRLIVAGRGDAALSLCRKITSCPAPALDAGNLLVHGNFELPPAGHAFDWHLLGPEEARPHWTAGELGLSFTGSGPDESSLLEQWVLLRSRNYLLEFEYQASAAGLRWAMSQGDLHQSTPPLAAAQDWRRGRWQFAMPNTGLARLRLIYRREPGTLRIVGRAAVRRVRLEVL